MGHDAFSILSALIRSNGAGLRSGQDGQDVSPIAYIYARARAYVYVPTTTAIRLFLLHVIIPFYPVHHVQCSGRLGVARI